MSWPAPPWERIQSLPDCFKQPRTVDSEPDVLVALWLLGSFGVEELGVVELPLGVCGFWLVVLPLPVLPLCANAMPVASVSVNNSFFVMWVLLRSFHFAHRATKVPRDGPARDI